MEASSFRSRYLPRPMGQRSRTELATVTNSFTRPLILRMELSTLTVLPEKLAGILPEGDTPSAIWGLTAESSATLTSRSPREERFLPLPLTTYSEILELAVMA